MSASIQGHVLLATENAEIRSMMSSLVTAGSILEFVHPAQVAQRVSSRSRVNVVLIDLALSAVSGEEIVAKLWASESNADFIVLMAQAGDWELAQRQTEGTALCLERRDLSRLPAIVERTLQRQWMTAKLTQERTRYQRLIERAPVGVFELRDGRFSYVNPYLLDVGGYAEQELLGHSPYEFVAPSDRERLLANVAARMHGNPSVAREVYAFVRKGGGIVEVQVESQLAETPEGPILAGSLRDVTAERRLTRLRRAVLALGETILVERDADRILQCVLEAIVAHSGFQRAVVSLYDLSAPDPMEGRVHKTLAAGLSPDELEQLKASKPISPAQRRMAFSDHYRLGSGYCIPHDRVPWDDDPGLSGRVTIDGWDKDDYLFIPLRGEAGIIGHVSVDDPVDRGASTVDSIEAVACLANIAALALERVHKLEHLERQKERLHSVSQFGRELSQAIEIGALCEIAVKRLRDDMDYDFCEIWLRDGDSLVLQAKAAQPGFQQAEPQEEGTRILLSQTGIVGWAIGHHEPLRVDDVRRDPRYLKARESVLSELAVPILGRKGPLGVINAESGRLAAFGIQDIEILTSFASQLSVAISNTRRRESLRRIHALGQGLAAGRSIDELISSALAFLADHFGLEYGAVLLCEGNELVIRGVRSPDGTGSLEIGERIPFGRGIVGRAATTGRSALVMDVAADPAYVEGSPETRSELALPMISAGKVLGVVNIESPQPGFFDEEDQQLLEAVANELAIAVSNLRSQDALREQAFRDPLTGVRNRQYFNDTIASELKRADRYGHPVSLMMLDVDGFRAVNNRLGHLRGDEVLQAVARFLEDSVRSTDSIIRYGGDEFLILMPETDGEPGGQSVQVAQRLKKGIAAVPGLLGLASVEIGLSVGIYTRQPQDPRSVEEILEEADRRLYADKRATHPEGDEYRH